MPPAVNHTVAPCEKATVPGLRFAEKRILLEATAVASLPSPYAVRGPPDGGQNRGTGMTGGGGSGVEPSAIDFGNDLNPAGWTPRTGGFRGANVKMVHDLSTTHFPDIIRNQGKCLGCWAATAVEHFQAVLSATQAEPPGFGGMNIRLSIQQLIDCSTARDTYGCQGGSISGAFEYLSVKGINAATAYTYVLNGMKNKCAPVIDIPSMGGGKLYKASPAQFVSQPCTTSVCPANPANEQALLNFWSNSPVKSAQGQSVKVPVVAYVDANANWDSYQGGVFPASACSSSIGRMRHIVQIVGYGTDSATGKAFWLVRNSWGKDWGEGGYIRLEAGKNTCGLFNYVVYLSGGTVINNGFYPSPTTPSYPTPSYPSPSYPTPSYPSPSGSNSGSGNSIAAAVARQNADLSARLAQQQADLMAAMKKQQEALLRAGPRIK